jgi:predicted TPR repeat methyltransferase
MKREKSSSMQQIIGSKMSNRTEIHEQVLSAASDEELMQTYGKWAASYDSDLIGKWNYQGPAAAAKWVEHYWSHQVAPARAHVLDAGCGTGLVGEALHRLGFSTITGVDCSEDMLKQARAKGVYQTLQKVDLNLPLDADSHTYDLVTCVGTFTSAHVQPKALQELLRVTKPQGLLVATVRATFWEEAHFGQTLVDALKNSAATLLELRSEPYIPTEGSECKLLVLRAT